jgi:hypothetical protein
LPLYGSSAIVRVRTNGRGRGQTGANPVQPRYCHRGKRFGSQKTRQRR